jgi:hypothetical protein
MDADERPTITDVGTAPDDAGDLVTDGYPRRRSIRCIFFRRRRRRRTAGVSITVVSPTPVAPCRRAAANAMEALRRDATPDADDGASLSVPAISTSPVSRAGRGDRRSQPRGDPEALGGAGIIHGHYAVTGLARGALPGERDCHSSSRFTATT